MKGISLFANVGIAETFLADVGIDIVVANELLSKRCDFYRYNHPNTTVIEGDITVKSIYDKVIECGFENKVDFLIATPPCQGMSLAGTKNPFDPRNSLVKYAIDAILDLKPKYAMIENVVQQLSTPIVYNNKQITIKEYIFERLSKFYNINKNQIINTMDYSVPQSRKRAIFLLVRKDQNFQWEFPEKDEKIITLEEAIGHLPSLDPLIKEPEKRFVFPNYEETKEIGLGVNKYHVAKMAPWRQVEAMMHTPTGRSAFKNDVFYPKNIDGRKIKGGVFTYMRMDWNKPAPTVTMYNGSISSFTNVHPGRKQKNGTYSDARVLSIYELMIITSLPESWGIPEWATENFTRQVIGEAIPPLLVKKIVLEIFKGGD